MQLEENLEKYESGAVVSFYQKQTELQPCEAYLFNKYLRPDLEILDMGVGGGRTTPTLSRGARRYVGADYSRAMVNACRSRFPSLDFRHCDATDMSQFADSTFDAVVFSFNGIDVINSDEARQRCISETARVLRPGGLFIFSSHNAKVLGVWPMLVGASAHQVVWRVLRSIVKTGQLSLKAISGATFSTGQGYIRDPVHGGMDHYVSTPETIGPQLAAHGLFIIEHVGGHYPTVKSLYLTPWHYYVCRKAEQA
jgi:ubiquinone/menaquinone biosynthesis C-methylase UbiE